MPRELKKYGLRSVRKPALKYLLSSVVKVRDEEGRGGYCYVRFDEPLIEAVGKKLTRGLAPFDPAYLVAEYDVIRKLWVIGARYLKTDEGVILWEQDEKPAWLKEVYHGNNRSEADGKTSRAGTSKAGTPDSARGKEGRASPDDYNLAA